MIGFIPINSKRRPKRGEKWTSFPGVERQLRVLGIMAKAMSYELMGAEFGYRINRSRSPLSHPTFLRALQRARENNVPLIVANVFELMSSVDHDRAMSLLEQLDAQDVPIFSGVHLKWLGQLSPGQRAINLLYFSGYKTERSKRIKQGLDEAGDSVPKHTPSQQISKLGGASATAKADAFARQIAPMVNAVIETLSEKGKRSHRAIAQALNDHQVPTSRGAKWHGPQVQRHFKRIERLESRG